MKGIISKFARSILALFLATVCALSSSACAPLALYDFATMQDQEETADAWRTEAEGKYNKLSFEELSDQLFFFEVSKDTLTLNQLVSDPSTLKIETPRPATYGEFSFETTQEDNAEYREMLEALTNGQASKTETLNEEQQTAHDYLKRILSLELDYEGYYYYQEPLSPSRGYHAMLPFTLMDYSFRTLDDIDIYLELLEDTPRFFSDLIAHEEIKEEKGVLMAREAMAETIEEARSYLGDAKNHVLTTTFNEMIDTAVESAKEAGEDSELARLSSEALQEYKEQNIERVEAYVIPAYQLLIKGLEPLVASCGERTRIGDYGRGNEYYELQMELMGFSTGALEAAATLDDALEEYGSILSQNSVYLDLYSSLLEEAVLAIGDSPEEYITYIKEHSAAEFAGAGDLAYQVKLAPEGMPNEYLMAYYLVPPVDDAQKNTVVFFPDNIRDSVELYSTMAHEAYPGHMYQTYAYGLQNPSNISKVLGSTAYTEGWAMYAQAQTLRYLDVNAGATEAYSVYDKFVYALQARVDIGINFEGWNIKNTKDYLAQWNFDSLAEDLYDASTMQPLSYLPYGLGVVEFDAFRTRAESQLASNFDALSYHREVTRFGPIPLDMLEEKLEAWLSANKSNQLLGVVKRA